VKIRVTIPVKTTASIIALAAALFVADCAHRPAKAQNLLGPVFTPHLYGMKPPRADNAWVRQRTAKSTPPKGYRTWAEFYGRQHGISACMSERQTNSRSYCEQRGY
jgi:hypothetical protein